MPAMPMMPPPMSQKMELLDTGQKTNLVGFACEQYDLKQRGRRWKSGRRTSCFRSSHTYKTSRIV